MFHVKHYCKVETALNVRRLVGFHKGALIVTADRGDNQISLIDFAARPFGRKAGCRLWLDTL